MWGDQTNAMSEILRVDPVERNRPVKRPLVPMSAQMQNKESANWKFEILDAINDDKRLSHAAKAVMIVFLHYASDDNRQRAFAGIDTIVDRANVAKHTAINCRDLLIKTGYLVPTGKKTELGATIYRLVNANPNPARWATKLQKEGGVQLVHPPSTAQGVQPVPPFNDNGGAVGAGKGVQFSQKRGAGTAPELDRELDRDSLRACAKTDFLSGGKSASLSVEEEEEREREAEQRWAEQEARKIAQRDKRHEEQRAKFHQDWQEAKARVHADIENLPANERCPGAIDESELIVAELRKPGDGLKRYREIAVTERRAP